MALGCPFKIISKIPGIGQNGLLNRGATNDEAIASMALELCNTDPDAGLSWEEAKACEVGLSWSVLEFWVLSNC